MASIDIDGFDDLEQLLQDMTITPSDEKKAMKKALEPIAQEVEMNAPERTGYSRKQIKTTVNKEDFATIGRVKLGAWYSIFNEFGTSQSKKWIGFFERSVNKAKDEAIEILTRELLK
jgi:HK97 gp10 family phage protein